MRSIFLGFAEAEVDDEAVLMANVAASGADLAHLA
jgi:hypothetical protein